MKSTKPANAQLLLLVTIIILSLSGILAGTGCSRSPQGKSAAFVSHGKKNMERKDYARAVLEFKNAIQATPKAAEPYFQLGLAYLALGDPRRGFASLRKATELDPKHTQAQLKIAELLLTKGSPDTLPEGQKRALEVLSADPGNPRALNMLALAEVRLGSPGNARQYLEQALQKFPQDLGVSVNLARVKLFTGDLSGAEEVLRAAARQAPNSANPRVALGNLYFASQKLTEAEAEFQAALNLDPKNGTALLSVAELRIRAGKFDEADQLYRRISALPSAEYKPLHAVFLLQSGNYTGAIAEFEKLFREDPQNRMARTRLVVAYLSHNRLADAEKVVGESLKRNPKDIDSLLQRSAIYLTAKQATAAQNDLLQVLRFRPNSAEAHFFLSKVHHLRAAALEQRQELTEALRLDPRLLQARIELAQNFLAAQSAKTAMELMNAAPQEQKESVPFVVQRNWVLIALSERTELRQALDRVLARTKTPELLLQDGLLKATEKDYVGARAAFEEVLARNRADLRTLQALARTFVAERRPDAALQRIQQQVSRVPNSADMHQFLGEWLVARNKTQEGRAAFQSAKSIDPGYTRADLSLAGLDLREGKADLARQRLASVVALDGGNIQALTILAIAEEQSGDFPAAIQHYRKVVERDPRNLLALNNLAYLLADRANQPDEALKYAQQVKEIAPDIGAVDDTMGWALYQKQIYVSAVKQLEAAVSREQVFTSEGLARCKYHLAMAYFKAGDRQRGQRSLESALKINPKLPEAKVAQEVRLATK